MSEGHDYGGAWAGLAGIVGGTYAWLSTEEKARSLAKFVFGGLIVAYSTWAIAYWQFPRIPLTAIVAVAGIAGISAVWILHKIEMRLKSTVEAVGNQLERVIETKLGVEIGPDEHASGASTKPVVRPSDAGAVPHAQPVESVGGSRNVGGVVANRETTT